MNKKALFKIISSSLLILFLLEVIFIAFYKFDNRTLELKFITDHGEEVISKTNYEIANELNDEITFENYDSLLLKEVKIYGKIKTIYLKKITFNEFASYVSNIDQGVMEWKEDGLLFTGEKGIRIIMNETFTKELIKLSASFLLERILLMELCVIFTLIALLVCSAMEEKMISENSNNHGPVFELKRFCNDIKKYWQYMVYAAKADLRAEVADSYLNRLWWLLEPFFNMVVYVIVFGNVLGSNIKNYATFVFSALLMWNFFNKILNYSVKLVRNNKDIVTKVYIPKFVLLLSNMILNMFKLLFSLIILIVMMVVFRVHVGINIIWVIPAYLLMLLLAYGVGMIFMHFGVYVDDLSYAVGILLNMLMFLSGIFYELMTALPSPLNTILMCLNPVAVFVDIMRNALLYNSVTNLPLLGIWLLIAVILCCFGVHIVYKNENSYVKVV